MCATVQGIGFVWQQGCVHSCLSSKLNVRSPDTTWLLPDDRPALGPNFLNCMSCTCPGHTGQHIQRINHQQLARCTSAHEPVPHNIALRSPHPMHAAANHDRPTPAANHVHPKSHPKVHNHPFSTIRWRPVPCAAAPAPHPPHSPSASAAGPPPPASPGDPGQHSRTGPPRGRPRAAAAAPCSSRATGRPPPGSGTPVGCEEIEGFSESLGSGGAGVDCWRCVQYVAAGGWVKRKVHGVEIAGECTWQGAHTLHISPHPILQPPAKHRHMPTRPRTSFIPISPAVVTPSPQPLQPPAPHPPRPCPHCPDPGTRTRGAAGSGRCGPPGTPGRPRCPAPARTTVAMGCGSDDGLNVN